MSILIGEPCVLSKIPGVESVHQRPAWTDDVGFPAMLLRAAQVLVDKLNKLSGRWEIGILGTQWIRE